MDKQRKKKQYAPISSLFFQNWGSNDAHYDKQALRRHNKKNKKKKKKQKKKTKKKKHLLSVDYLKLLDLLRKKKKHLFKYIDNFTSKNWKKISLAKTEKFQIKNSDVFSYFCSKT